MGTVKSIPSANNAFYSTNRTIILGGIFKQDIFHHLLTECEIFLFLDGPFSLDLVLFFVGLGPRGMHCRPLSQIKHAELNGSGIGKFAHFAAQGINFSNNLTFGNSTNCRITAH